MVVVTRCTEASPSITTTTMTTMPIDPAKKAICHNSKTGIISVAHYELRPRMGEPEVDRILRPLKLSLRNWART